MKDLIERLEKATGPDRELDADIHAAVYGGVPSQRAPHAWMRSYGPAFVFHDKEYGIATDKDSHARHYTASLDAALSLVPDGKDWHVEMCDGCALAAVGERIDIAFEPHKFPAIALCIAALKARIAVVRDLTNG